MTASSVNRQRGARLVEAAQSSSVSSVDATGMLRQYQGAYQHTSMRQFRDLGTVGLIAEIGAVIVAAIGRDASRGVEG